MNASNTRITVWAGIILAALGLLSVGLAQSEEQSAAEKARLKKLDDGPRTIDVTKYPDDLKAGYALMGQKCVKCHSLGRPINTHYVLPGEWQRYIKRMLYKPDSKMTDDQAKAIYRFLVYDASVRKADSLRTHLGLLPDAERKEAIDKIHELNPSFAMGK
jgi:hypothetical protein